MGSSSVVIVDDDFLIATFLADVCADLGYEVAGSAGDAEQAIETIVKAQPTFALLDMRLGGALDGVDVAQRVRAAGVQPILVFITGSNEPETLARIAALGAHPVLIKPIEPSALARTLALAQPA